MSRLWGSRRGCSGDSGLLKYTQCNLEGRDHMFPLRNGNSPLDSFHDTPLQRGTAPLRTYLCENKENKINVKSLHLSLLCEAVVTQFTFATATTFVRSRVCTFEACVVAMMTLSIPFKLPRTTGEYTCPIIKKPGNE